MLAVDRRSIRRRTSHCRSRSSRRRAGHHGSMDAAETPMLANETVNGSFRQWYAGQKRPALVLYFNRQLDQLPAGLARHQPPADRRYRAQRQGRRQPHHRDRRAAEQPAPGAHPQPAGQAVRAVARRRAEKAKCAPARFAPSCTASWHRSNRDSRTDIEYESLSRSARFVLEVELVCVGGECEAVAQVKDIRSGDVPASVRQKVDSLNSASEIDQVSRALVQRLMNYKVA